MSKIRREFTQLFGDEAVTESTYIVSVCPFLINRKGKNTLGHLKPVRPLDDLPDITVEAFSILSNVTSDVLMVQISNFYSYSIINAIIGTPAPKPSPFELACVMDFGVGESVEGTPLSKFNSNQIENIKVLVKMNLSRFFPNIYQITCASELKKIHFLIDLCFDKPEDLKKSLKSIKNIGGCYQMVVDWKDKNRAEFEKSLGESVVKSKNQPQKNQMKATQSKSQAPSKVETKQSNKPPTRREQKTLPSSQKNIPNKQNTKKLKEPKIKKGKIKKDSDEEVEVTTNAEEVAPMTAPEDNLPEFENGEEIENENIIHEPYSVGECMKISEESEREEVEKIATITQKVISEPIALVDSSELTKIDESEDAGNILEPGKKNDIPSKRRAKKQKNRKDRKNPKPNPLKEVEEATTNEKEDEKKYPTSQEVEPVLGSTELPKNGRVEANDEITLERPKILAIESKVPSISKGGVSENIEITLTPIEKPLKEYDVRPISFIPEPLIEYDMGPFATLSLSKSQPTSNFHEIKSLSDLITHCVSIKVSSFSQINNLREDIDKAKKISFDIEYSGVTFVQDYSRDKLFEAQVKSAKNYDILQISIVLSLEEPDMHGNLVQKTAVYIIEGCTKKDVCFGSLKFLESLSPPFQVELYKNYRINLNNSDVINCFLKILTGGVPVYVHNGIYDILHLIKLLFPKEFFDLLKCTEISALDDVMNRLNFNVYDIRYICKEMVHLLINSASRQQQEKWSGIAISTVYSLAELSYLFLDEKDAPLHNPAVDAWLTLKLGEYFEAVAKENAEWTKILAASNKKLALPSNKRYNNTFLEAHRNKIFSVQREIMKRK